MIRAVAATILFLFATGQTVLGSPMKKRGTMESTCTKAVKPTDVLNLNQLVANEVPAGGVLCLAPGTYKANLWLDKSITVRGMGGPGDVVIDGAGARPAVQVTDDEATVVLENLTLKNGFGSKEHGANLNIFDSKMVTIRNVVFSDGIAQAGAVMVRQGEARFENCVFTHNEGRLAQALFVYNDGKARLTNCRIFANRGEGPAVAASWIASVTIEHSTIVSDNAAIRAAGTGSQAPTVEVRQSILRGSAPVEVVRGGHPTPTVVIEHCAVTAAPTGEGVSERDNLVSKLIELDNEAKALGGSALSRYGAK